MTFKNIILGVGLVLILILAGYFSGIFSKQESLEDLDPTPRNIILSGAYVCLPFIDTKAPTNEECVFGLETDDGVYYMVNFGQSASAKEQFNKRVRITAEGFVVPKEALSTDEWVPYNMKGIFTITKMLE